MQQAAKSARAAARNRESILRVLLDTPSRPALVLEIAIGAGEHAVWFSSVLPNLTPQPTDHAPEALSNIATWRYMSGPPNLLPPLRLEAPADTWPVAHSEAVVAINMVHVAPWSVTQGLIASAERPDPRWVALSPWPGADLKNCF
jgi:Protein of unknown function (DUF938)